ncbi:YfcE family phosphodiesterase [Malaciobacter halophilus]|uniref:Phosphoesterase n=1 Tax=Malaciobacter halophilus TaxID=197482 RepID=A0A2N1J4C1_9BACT|nr:YfcE family phosphodiesterase [Malaciobacter halophilus]AXH10906.1 YfcE family phosphodiesterase [Malaciobacter halophilus]PKI81411.1 YfcE family phosphodiesterase [Malaciobacter halophilus]
MKIGILSDSHTRSDYTDIVIKHLKKQGAQYLIHAGDLCIEDNLKLLQNSKLVYVTVFGNNDNSLFSLANEYKIKKEPYYFKIKDIKFKLMHLPYYLNADSDIIVFGHTHKFECSYNNGTLFINPGEVCAREKPLSESVLLEINENEYIINYYFRDIHSNNFKKEEFRYER